MYMEKERNLLIQGKLGNVEMAHAEMEAVEVKNEVKVLVKQDLPVLRQVDT